MVILKNIEKNNKTISADYYPEGGSEKGFMEIDLKDLSVVYHENVSSFAAAHVRRELRRLSNYDKMPNERTLLWY